MHPADLAAIVLTYGPAPAHGPLVEKLCAQGIHPERIAVVHNPVHAAAGDEQVVDGVEIVRNATNLGDGSAINVGLRRHRVSTAPAVLMGGQ